MSNKGMKKLHTRRIIALILFCVMLFFLATIRAFEYQVVDSDSYIKQANAGRSTTVAIAAARGEIVDRNGVPFTQNRAVFNVEFDFNLMERAGRTRQLLDDDAANATICRLIQVFEAKGEEWLDHLPISMEAPYEFAADATETELTRLRSENMANVNSYATAEDCIYQLFKKTAVKKYQENGKCTHCGEKFEDCEYEEYTEEMSRKIVGVRYEMLLKDFSVNNTRFTFAEDISAEMVAWLEEQSDKFPGIVVVQKAMRTYVSGDVASHLIGRVGPIYKESWDFYKEKNAETGAGYTMDDTVGQAAIEGAMEDALRGKNGEMTIYFDSKGNIIHEEETVVPVAGSTVQLTLDFAFQQELQQILADYIAEFNESAVAQRQDKHSEAAALVVMDMSGGVLACVSYPYFDILDYINNYNTVLKAEGNPLFNRALQGLYAPGSSFKPIVAAASLSEGIIDSSSRTYCGLVYDYYAPSYTPGCLGTDHAFSSINVSQALQHSCNIFFYDAGRRLGIEKMNDYARKFGFASDTGLEIGNATGRLTSRDDAEWQGADVVQAAIGQKNTQATPLQMALEALTIANRGTRYQAHLVKGLLTNDGSEVISETEPEIMSQFDLSDEVYELIAQGMTAAARGIGYPNQVTDLEGMPAIKTGSPQTGRYDANGTMKSNNDFIAFYPEENPEIAISCLVEDGYNTNQLLRRILLAWEKTKNGGVLPEKYQPAAPDPASSETVTPPEEGDSSEGDESGGQNSDLA